MIQGKDQFSPHARKAGTSATGLKGKMGSLGNTVVGVGAGFIAAQASIAGVKTIMSSSIGAAVAYEAQMAEIQALTGATKTDTDFLTVAIKGMTKTMPKSPAELGAAAYFILSSGIEDAADAADVLEVAAKASTVGLGETEAVADALTTVINAYGLEAGDAAGITDIMMEAVKQGKAEADEFAGVLGRVVPIAAQMGISFEEVAANLATFTRLGVSADEAATGLRAVMASLLKPTKDQEKAMGELGLSAEGLRQQIKDKGLLATLNAMMQATGGNSDAVARLFPNIRALTSVLGTAGGQMETYTDILGATSDATGNLDEGFAIVSDTAKFKMGVAMNELNLMLMELGEEILPAIVPAMGAVVFAAQTLAEAMNLVIVPIKTISGIFGAAFDDMPPKLEIVTEKLQDMAGNAELTEGKFIELAQAAGMTLQEAEALAADTTFKTQMEVWRGKALDFGVSLEEVDRIQAEMATSFGWSASDIQSDIDNMKRKADDFKAKMADEVAPDAEASLQVIEDAASDAEAALKGMFQTTTLEEVEAEAALANYKLEAGLLEGKVGGLTAAEAARLTQLNDELIPAEQDNLDLINLQKDAVEKNAAAQVAAGPAMTTWKTDVEKQAGAVEWLNVALGLIPSTIDTTIALHLAQSPELDLINEWIAAGGGSGSIVPMQHGGIVTKPTMALLGERGPEAVIPLGGGGTPSGVGKAGGTPITINFNGPILGDHRQAMQFANFIRPELERALT